MRMLDDSTILVCVIGVVMGACAFTNQKVVEDVLPETPRGAVFLQHAEDGWFRTAHPFELSIDLLATVLRGMHVQRSSIDAAIGERVFSDADTEFLSPLLHTGLSRANRHQVVGFRIMHNVEGRTEMTGGFVYIQGRLLHLTLTHYRARFEGAALGGPALHLNPNPTGLDQHRLTFTPTWARKTSRHEQPDVLEVLPLASLVLDYDTLIEGMTLPPTSIQARPIRHERASFLQQIIDPAFSINETPSAPIQHSLPTDTSRIRQAPSTGEEGDLERLKEEVRRLRRRLSDLEESAPRTK